MKIWQKESAQNSSELIEQFTVGRDREFDMELAEWDVLGSLAHIRMLQSIHLLSSEEYDVLSAELKKIHSEIKFGNFSIHESVEDIHSQVEWMLTQRIGEAGKKIHSGRSRNDQVLVDIKLYLRDQCECLVNGTEQLFHTLLQLSEKHKEDLLPGYTHFQLAMPSSFGLWFGAYAESLTDDMESLLAAYKIINRNPLGSGAGYGSSFPLNRKLTTELLGFERMNYNVVYAQMTRAKAEKNMAMAMANIAATLSKFSMDVCLYMNQNFGFITFPSHLTTGSSIMPHKKNPDVFELIRAKCNRIQAVPNEFAQVYTNLPSGYHRDSQLTKDILFPAIKEMKDCLHIANYMLQHIVVKKDILNHAQYDNLFTVETVNNMVLRGVPFREAYKQVGLNVEAGTYKADRKISHTHEGSIGNLCPDEIKAAFMAIRETFGFEKVNKKLRQLLE